MWGTRPNLQTVNLRPMAGERGQRPPMPRTPASHVATQAGPPPAPVGGLQEERPLEHLLGHMHIILAPDGHGVGLPQQVLSVVVHVVRVLTQLGKVMDLDGGVGARGGHD